MRTLKPESTPKIMMLRLAAALLLCVLLATVATAQHRPSREAMARTTERITRQVRHELLMLPWYSVFDNLEFRVQGSTVMLTGQVIHGSLKSGAERAARRVEGVERVENRIEILPPFSSDDRIRAAVYRAIYSQTGFTKYAIQPVPPIHIIVRAGRVMLAGVVDNETDRNLAYIAASGVPGTFEVTNHLRVERAGK